MTQELANRLQLEFLQITDIKVDAKYFPKGPLHQPSTLSSGWQGVYVFLNESYCFKVGKAGPKSKARWNSHHYNLDKATPSAFAKSIIKNRERFKSYFAEEKHSDIDQLSKANIGEWIKNNISRIELLLPQSEGEYALNLLEALVQYRLTPKYEGKNA